MSLDRIERALARLSRDKNPDAQWLLARFEAWIESGGPLEEVLAPSGDGEHSLARRLRMARRNATLTQVFTIADKEQISTAKVADKLAEVETHWTPPGAPSPRAIFPEHDRIDAAIFTLLDSCHRYRVPVPRTPQALGALRERLKPTPRGFLSWPTTR